MTDSRRRRRVRGRRSAAHGPPGGVQDRLERAGISPRHRWGQHFMQDRDLLARQVAYAELDGSQSVLEIGGGPGNLTALLAPRCRLLTVLEMDRRFSPLLQDLQRRHPNVRVIWGDALQVQLPPVDVVVANLPFGPALPLTFRLVRRRFRRAVLLYQLRLARRLAARVGEAHYGRLSVLVGRVAEVEILERVPPSAFFPPPRVDSALVLLRRTDPRFSVPEESFFEQILAGLFLRREETLDTALGALRGSKYGGLFRSEDVPYRAAVRGLEGRLLGKQVFRITPREFGRIAWCLWRTAGR